MSDLHGRLYFRSRENGAAVFRIDTRNKSRSLEMQQIANISLKKSEFRPQGEAVISDDERAEIEAWIETRQKVLKTREAEDLERLIDDLKATIHWIVSQAEPSDIEPLSEELLLTLHDLRSVIVRKKAEGLG